MGEEKERPTKAAEADEKQQRQQKEKEEILLNSSEIDEEGAAENAREPVKDATISGTKVHAMEVADKEEQEKEGSEHSQDSKARDPLAKPRQWIIDRCNGQSKIDPDSRPCFPSCWPPPCVRLCPDALEQNVCCETYGKVGCIDPSAHRHRTWIMAICIVTHALGLTCSVLACFAISMNPELLKIFPFSSGSVTGTVSGGNRSFVVDDIFIKIGVQGAYVDDFFDRAVWDFKTLCNHTEFGFFRGIPLTEIDKCYECAQVSGGLIFSLIMGVLTYIPSISTNFTRMYSNYDVNCQKTFGSIVALFSMCFSLYSWQGYANSCFASFYDGHAPPMELTVPNVTLEMLEKADFQWDPDFQGPVVANLYFDWHPGLGLALSVLAVFIKIIDVIAHCILKTPTITRDRNEQWEYERSFGGDLSNDHDYCS